MKKWDTLKNVQLILYMLFAAGTIFLVTRFGGNSVNNMLLWITLAIGFVFLFVDFGFMSRFSLYVRDLMDEVGSDPETKVNNRHSINLMLAKCNEEKVKENFAVVAFEIANIREINMRYSRSHGDEAICEFASILRMASVKHCFVGRNSGTIFLAIFQEAGEGRLEEFLQRVEEKITEHNKIPGKCSIYYTYGVGTWGEERPGQIEELVAKAQRRIKENKVPKEAYTDDELEMGDD